MSKRGFIWNGLENLPDDIIWKPIKHLEEPEVHDLFPEDISQEGGEDSETNEGQGDDWSQEKFFCLIIRTRSGRVNRHTVLG